MVLNHSKQIAKKIQQFNPKSIKDTDFKVPEDL